MSSTINGVTRVPSNELKRLLKALHRGLLRTPITRSGLIEAAFGHLEAELDAFVGRDQTSAQALIVCVLAERTQAETKLVASLRAARLEWQDSQERDGPAS